MGFYFYEVMMVWDYMMVMVVVILFIIVIVIGLFIVDFIYGFIDFCVGYI